MAGKSKSAKDKSGETPPTKGATPAARKKKAAPKKAGKKPAARKASGRAAQPAQPAMAPETAAILGLGSNGFLNRDPSTIRPEWRKYYRTLLDLRQRLLEQMGELAKESAEQVDGYSLHMADTGTDNFDRDFALSLLSSDQDSLYEIDEALKRIVNGTYGICELTGKPIPKARLDAVPWARFTVEAQAKLEKEGTLRQRRLSSSGTIGGAGGLSLGGEEDESEEGGPGPKE